MSRRGMFEDGRFRGLGPVGASGVYAACVVVLMSVAAVGAVRLVALVGEQAAVAIGFGPAQTKAPSSDKPASGIEAASTAGAPTAVVATGSSGSGVTLAGIVEGARSSRGLGEGSDDGARFYSGDGDTYRTVCVRLCDGYFWPISFSTTDDYFDRDKATCESSCGASTRLYVLPNPGSHVEDMKDLAGQPYRRLRTAFQFRARYDAACTCRPQPWDEAARDRHRLYALETGRRKGSKEAAREIAEIKSRAIERTAAKGPIDVPRKVASSARATDTTGSAAEVLAAGSAWVAPSRDSAGSTSSLHRGAVPGPFAPVGGTALALGSTPLIASASIRIDRDVDVASPSAASARERRPHRAAPSPSRIAGTFGTGSSGRSPPPMRLGAPSGSGPTPSAGRRSKAGGSQPAWASRAFVAN